MSATHASATKIVHVLVRVIMRPPRPGERCWWVFARNAEDALSEVLRESEDLGFVTTCEHDGSPDAEGMIPVTVEIAPESAAREAHGDEVSHCPVCHEPGHPSETDDLGRHPECQ